MPRTPRHSFPCVHSLYLSTEQDAELRDLAEQEERTVSEVMRTALAEYLVRHVEQARRRHEEAERASREAIAEAARLRKLARRSGRVPALAGVSISGDTIVWQPPTNLRAPKPLPYPRRLFPMSVDYDGNPIEPPANAIGWRVLARRHRGGRVDEYLVRGAPLVVDLRVKHHEFAYAVGNQSAAYYLEAIDETGRVLRFPRIYVPLGAATEWDED